MQDILIVVDMQNDFVDGALGSKDAQAIVDQVTAKIQGFSGPVLFTRDTHGADYLQTQEGRNLPVPHCVENTPGWQLCPAVAALCHTEPVNKVTFGSRQLAERLCEMNAADPLRSVTLIGLCTDICVISNAMVIKAFLPEVEIIVDAACCAGVTPESHHTALNAMRACQVKIENDK